MTEMQLLACSHYTLYAQKYLDTPWSGAVSHSLGQAP
uniref:Uncharacterized protein n=1 Tax=Anguilla anguilla TaxID=7936 RepID=A0A0E9TRI7_ANGAN